jgi:hypothetical protein
MISSSVSMPCETIDQSELAEVVRKDQGSADFRITDWNVRPLSGKGLMNPDGLLLLSGQGQDGQGQRPWSVVLKKFSLDGVANTHPGHLFYWKRELALSQSGLLERLPGPVAVPRIYRTAEWEGGGLAWLEFIQDTSPSRWTLDQYRFAGRQLGRMSGACVMAGFLPDEPWLCRNHLRDWLDFSVIYNWSGKSWVFDPRVVQTFSAKAMAGAIRLLDEREAFIQVTEQLPQVFSHFDFQRRNLIIRQTDVGQDELVALDWAMAGTSALGGELVPLIGASAFLFEIEPGDLPNIESEVYQEYLAGLQEAGWDGDQQRLRLAYTIWLALWCGANGPGSAGYWGAENGPGIAQFDCQPEEMLAGWAILSEFAVERGEEARRLIQKLF